MTVLVTGGAGYIGSHVVRMLVGLQREVVVIDSLETGHRDAVLGVPLVVGDIADKALVSGVVGEYRVDSVIHFAAYKAPEASMVAPERYFANNVAGTVSLLDVLVQAGVTQFVFSSTCAVYGTPKRLPVDEDHELGPESPYGESKLIVERMLNWMERCHGMRSVSLRYFNAAGASADGVIGEDWRSTSNLVPLAMKAALGRAPKLIVFGTDYPTPDGSAIRDYIHVEDLADAHVRALEYLERGGEGTVVNLGSATGTSVLEIVDATRRLTGTELPVELTGRRAGDPVAVYADNTRATEVLGWKPTRNLDDIVSSAWQWHSTHPDGYGS